MTPIFPNQTILMILNHFKPKMGFFYPRFHPMKNPQTLRLAVVRVFFMQFSVKQIFIRNVQKFFQAFQQFNAGLGVSNFPVADGFETDVQFVCQIFLRYVLFIS